MSFLIYKTGKQFIDDNNEIFQKYPIETCFFKLNALNMPDMSNGFAVKVIDGDNYVIALRFKEYPMVIFANNDSLLNNLAKELLQNKFSFMRILGPDTTVKAFLSIYEQLAGGTHKIIHSMDIMKCDHINENNTDTSMVEFANEHDINEIAEIVKNFEIEVGEPQSTMQCIIENVKNTINDFVLIRLDNKIVSLAKKTRDDDKTCAISNVFTRTEYRGKGLSRKIMTFITNYILQSGKIPYLFVDKENPITNHLYASIGFKYLNPITEIMHITNKSE